MNLPIIRRTTLAAAVLGCMALAGTGFAQTYTAPSEPKGSSPQSASERKTPSAIPSKSESAASAFEKLDTTHSGYVTKAETAKLEGFDTAFEKADVSHNGKLNQSEFSVAWRAYTGRGS
jgi:hypothetical protein